MKCVKKAIQMILALLVLGIGAYMMLNYKFPTPPAISGMAFIFIGASLWLPNCPLMKTLCGGSCKR